MNQFFYNIERYLQTAIIFPCPVVLRYYSLDLLLDEILINVQEQNELSGKKYGRGIFTPVPLSGMTSQAPQYGCVYIHISIVIVWADIIVVRKKQQQQAIQSSVRKRRTKQTNEDQQRVTDFLNYTWVYIYCFFVQVR